jgi:hypothetical protein
MIRAYEDRNAKARRRGAADNYVLTQYRKIDRAIERYTYCTRSPGRDVRAEVAMPLTASTASHWRPGRSRPESREVRRKAAQDRSF